MRFKRSQRLQELLLKEISDIIRQELKDPRIGMATLTRIDLADNLQYAKVYVSVLGNHDDARVAMEGFRSARGFIRSQLGKNLYLKYIPELEFIKDENPEYADRISKLLDQIHTGGSD